MFTCYTLHLGRVFLVRCRPLPPTHPPSPPLLLMGNATKTFIMQSHRDWEKCSGGLGCAILRLSWLGRNFSPRILVLGRGRCVHALASCTLSFRAAAVVCTKCVAATWQSMQLESFLDLPRRIKQPANYTPFRKLPPFLDGR